MRFDSTGRDGGLPVVGAGGGLPTGTAGVENTSGALDGKKMPGHTVQC